MGRTRRRQRSGGWLRPGPRSRRTRRDCSHLAPAAARSSATTRSASRPSTKASVCVGAIGPRRPARGRRRTRSGQPGV